MNINDKVLSITEIHCVDPKTKQHIITIPKESKGIVMDVRSRSTPTGDVEFLAVKFKECEYPIVLVEDGKEFFIKDHIELDIVK